MTEGHGDELRAVPRQDIARIYDRLGSMEREQAVAAMQAQHTRERVDEIAGAVIEIRRKVSNGLSERLARVEDDVGTAASKLAAHLREVSEQRKTVGARLWSIAAPVIVSLITAVLTLGSLRAIVEATVQAAVAAAIGNAP